jgi:DNA-binding phage protein
MHIVERKKLASAPGASAAALIQEVQRRSGLSQAELARRAGLPRSVLNAYLWGQREPGVDALLRVVSAGGFKLHLEDRRPRVDPERAGKILAQVLDLAEALPFRPRAELPFPKLADRLNRASART